MFSFKKFAAIFKEEWKKAAEKGRNGAIKYRAPDEQAQTPSPKKPKQ